MSGTAVQRILSWVSDFRNELLCCTLCGVCVCAPRLQQRGLNIIFIVVGGVAV